MHSSEPLSKFDSLMNSVGDHARAVYMAAFRNLMLPLVRMAMRHGLSHDELHEALRRAMAECAKDLHPAADRSTSQLAILTGIPRAHAERIKQTLAVGAAEELSNLTLIGRLIAGWQRDFVGPYGIPLELPLEAGEHSFPDLVRRFGGKAPAMEVLEDLKRVGVVEITQAGRARLTNRPYITGRLKPESMERMSWVIRDLAETLDFNLNPSRGAPARFERRMYTHEPLSGPLLEAFREVAQEEGQGFLARLDNWLNEQLKEIRKRRRNSGADYNSMADAPDAKHVGVGVYWIEKDSLSAQGN
jgi:hypothetical protein